MRSLWIWILDKNARLRAAYYRRFGTYARATLRRWETPVVDIMRLLPVSLTDQDRKLVAVYEASWEPERPRWKVTFTRVAAYRAGDEMHSGQYWVHRDRVARRCGETFIVERSPWLKELVEMQPLKHYVVTTLDEVLEVAAEVEPTWETAPPAEQGSPMPGKVQHYFWPDDRTEVLAEFKRIEDAQTAFRDKPAN